MIFVTLGTGKQQFKRLLKEIDKLIEKEIIKEEIIVQSFNEKYIPKNFKIIKMLDKKQYNKYLKESRLIITHGGVGTILDGLKIKKTIIAFPRLTKYKEAVNDHQIQIIEAFYKKGYILTGEIKELKDLLEQSKKFEAQLYISNKEKFNDFIIDLI